MIRKTKEMSRWQKLTMTAAVCLMVYTLVGFLILPPILRSVLQNKISENLHRQTVIEDIDVNPYALSCLLEGFVINDRESSDTFVSFDRLYLNVEMVSLFKWALIAKEIRLEQPYISLVRHEEAHYNFSDLIPASKENSQESEPSEPLRFSLNNIQILNGSIDIRDKPKEKKHKIADMKIQIPSISNEPHRMDIFAQPLFEARFNETPVSLKGKTKPFHDTLETVFDVDLRDINVPHYLAYVPIEQRFKVLSGLLDVKGTLSYVQRTDALPVFSLAGDVILKTAEVVDADDNPVLKLPRLYIAIAPTELFSRKIHLSRISVESPEVNILRDKAGNTNIQSILPEKGTKNAIAESDEDAPPLSVKIDEIMLATGKVIFSDISGSQPFETTIEPIDVSVSHFSTDRDEKTAFKASIQTEANEKVTMTGEFSLDPFSAESNLGLQGVVLSKYAPYYMEKVTFDVEEGKLEFQTGFRYSKNENGFELLLSNLSTTVNSLTLRKRGEKEPFAQVPLLAVKGTDVDLVNRRLTIGEVSTKKGIVNCVLYKNGDLNLATLVLPPRESTQAEPSEDLKPWHVTLNKAVVHNYTVNGIDLTRPEPVKIVLDEIKLGAQGISTIKKSKGKLDLACRFNEKGTVSAKGTVGINPVFADLNTKLKGLRIRALQPYFTDKVKIDVTGGSFSTTGRLSLDASRNKQIAAGYKGSAGLYNLIAVDKLHSDDLVKWKALRLNRIDFGYNPMYVNVEEIVLDDFYTRLIVDAEGKLNLQAIVVEKTPRDDPPAKVEKKEKVSASEEGEALFKSVGINRVRLTKGHVNFTDKSIDPVYAADLVKIEGTVSGLSSAEDKLADVYVSGKLDDYAPLVVAGKVNPLSENFHADLRVTFKNIDLSPMTPYAGKYVGYTVQKGKLSLDLTYLIEKGKLDSKNNVFLDQLTFGDKVDSPDATNLPVKLGVSLLKNRAGEIDLDLPVSGDLGDPEFGIGKIIVKIILNLLVKAATSPFSLLGAVFGGGEELSFLEFDSGRSELTDTSHTKLDTMTQALYDRPALNLDIEGHVDLEQDGEGLRQHFFDKQLKAQKHKDLMKKDSPAISVDEITIGPEEYEEYLWKAYKAADFKKQKNVLGLTKKLPMPEMEQLLLENINVEEDDLRMLAIQRAQRVKDYILQSEKVEPERIFLIEPQSLAPEGKGTLKDSRVDLRLK